MYFSKKSPNWVKGIKALQNYQSGKGKHIYTSMAHFKVKKTIKHLAFQT
jgi:hypothetical protein